MWDNVDGEDFTYEFFVKNIIDFITEHGVREAVESYSSTAHKAIASAFDSFLKDSTLPVSGVIETLSEYDELNEGAVEASVREMFFFSALFPLYVFRYGKDTDYNRSSLLAQFLWRVEDKTAEDLGYEREQMAEVIESVKEYWSSPVRLFVALYENNNDGEFELGDADNLLSDPFSMATVPIRLRLVMDLGHASGINHRIVDAFNSVEVTADSRRKGGFERLGSDGN